MCLCLWLIYKRLSNWTSQHIISFLPPTTLPFSQFLFCNLPLWLVSLAHLWGLFLLAPSWQPLHLKASLTAVPHCHCSPPSLCWLPIHNFYVHMFFPTPSYIIWKCYRWTVLQHYHPSCGNVAGAGVGPVIGAMTPITPWLDGVHCHWHWVSAVSVHLLTQPLLEAHFILFHFFLSHSICWHEQVITRHAHIFAPHSYMWKGTPLPSTLPPSLTHTCTQSNEMVGFGHKFF